MTPEQQNIAIAEACGWSRRNDHRMSQWIALQGGAWNDPPAYHSDLNACAEFESALTDDDHFDYRVTLAYVVSGKPGAYGLRGFNRQYVSATAPQRCEAFLKTINKWTP